ncbi:hypothetical protein GE21DRAFT_1209448, partial [Neurospora crassa]
KLYIKKTGSLNYLSIGTRLNITFTINKLYEANTNPTIGSLAVLKHLFKYLIKYINEKLYSHGEETLFARGSTFLPIYNPNPTHPPPTRTNLARTAPAKLPNFKLLHPSRGCTSHPRTTLASSI